LYLQQQRARYFPESKLRTYIRNVSICFAYRANVAFQQGAAPRVNRFNQGIFPR